MKNACQYCGGINGSHYDFEQAEEALSSRRRLVKDVPRSGYLVVFCSGLLQEMEADALDCDGFDVYDEELRLPARAVYDEDPPSPVYGDGIQDLPVRDYLDDYDEGEAEVARWDAEHDPWMYL